MRDSHGDGKADIEGRETVGGSCWVGLSDGSSITSTLWGTWSPGVDWADQVAADFNGDGKDDLAARMVPTGQRWVAVSSGSNFTTTRSGTWTP